MALNTRTQAACLLLLLLTSLASASVLHQTKQLADLQTQDTAGVTAGAAAGATAGLTPGLQRLWRRDTHFPICIFCCGCCHPSKCGICCKT